MIAGVVLLLLGLGAFFLVGGEPGPVVRAYFPVLFGAMVAILLSVIAAWVHQPRFYIYAILIFLAGVAHQWGAVDLWLTVVSAGTAIVASGAVVLLRFLRNNPRIGEGQN